jgi:Putative beta-barrel porin-2, OmpL-like. bbp2
LEQLGVGGDFHYDNVRGRLMTQFGMYSETTPRNDPSPGHGQWDLADAYRYVSEAYGGYHFNVLHGINVDAGIFMSYIGLFSYYNFDNWAYQPSYVSSNTPWFFNGVRVQIFPTAHLKIEPWFINGWQSYASANHTPGVGGQIKWTPEPWLNIISNNYGVGQDDLFTPGRRRIHTDNSVEVKYFDKPERTLDKMAFSLTGDLGCEYGAGVSCHGDTKGGPKQSFIGYMFYNRFWFHRDLYGLTVGGGQINNPGRYLVLLPPINGETAITAATNSPYFTENPGNPFKAWDSSITFDYMPKQYITFRWEYDYRHASVPYWSGAGGITPPGGNNNSPQFYTCSNGSSSGQALLGPAETACGGGISSVWFPDLRKDESFIDLSILVKF